MKKKMLKTLSLMSVIFLASCANDTISSSIDSESKEDTISSNSSQEQEGGFYAEFSSTNLTLGKTFNEAASPRFYLNGSEIDLDSLTTISLKLGNESFSLDAPLTKTGTYIFLIRKGGNSFGKEFVVSEGNTETATEGNGYSKVSDEDAKKYSLQNVPYAGSLTYGKMPSTGMVNILVIPVVFKDVADEYKFTEDELNTIEKGYFGEASETGWESLASYYEKSSYGRLHIQGKVSAVYTSEFTTKKLQDLFFSTGMTPEATNQVMNAAVEKAFQDNPSWDRKSFDNDGDGFLDGIELIYKTDKTYGSGEDGSQVWWNFTTYDDGNKANEDTPSPRRYFWSNISQLQTGYYKTNIDTHTLVHETGHLLGLNDYYDSAYSMFPTGGADMMELNIGDHDAYSKYLLGWVNPMAVDGSLDDFEITLNDFESSGDCVLIRNTTTDKWNGTPYDEYLMLSYYTPTGLNEQDSKGYKEWINYGTGGSYTYRGLQVFHVDERLYTNVGSTMNTSGNITNGVRSYTDDVLSGPTETDSHGIITKDYAYQATSNTQANSYEVNDNSKLVNNSSFKEITLVPASGNASLYKTTSRDYSCKLGSEDALMGLSEYGAKYNGYSTNKMKSCFTNKTTFNDGSKLEYNFFVSAQTDSTITVRFVKNC